MERQGSQGFVSKSLLLCGFEVSLAIGQIIHLDIMLLPLAVFIFVLHQYYRQRMILQKKRSILELQSKFVAKNEIKGKFCHLQIMITISSLNLQTPKKERKLQKLKDKERRKKVQMIQEQNLQILLKIKTSRNHRQKRKRIRRPLRPSKRNQMLPQALKGKHLQVTIQNRMEVVMGQVVVKSQKVRVNKNHVTL